MTDRQAKKTALNCLIRYYGKVWSSDDVSNVYRVVDGHAMVFSLQEWRWRKVKTTEDELLLMATDIARDLYTYSIKRFTARQVRAFQRCKALVVKNKVEQFLKENPLIDD